MSKNELKILPVQWLKPITKCIEKLITAIFNIFFSGYTFPKIKLQQDALFLDSHKASVRRHSQQWFLFKPVPKRELM